MLVAFLAHGASPVSVATSQGVTSACVIEPRTLAGLVAFLGISACALQLLTPVSGSLSLPRDAR